MCMKIVRQKLSLNMKKKIIILDRWLDMRLNYYYNFKNTIRFFMDIENMDFSKVQQNKKSWSVPFKFRIKKDG